MVKGMTIDNEHFKNKNYDEFIEFKGNLQGSNHLDNLLDLKREKNRYVPHFSE